MSTWPPRADDVFKCLYDILLQCTQCEYIPVGIHSSTLVNKATVPSMYNVGMSEANVEYSQVMPANTKKFLMHTEDGSEFRIAFEMGHVAGFSPPFFTVPVNTSYNEDLIEPPELSLYFAGICSGLTMEIIAWA